MDLFNPYKGLAPPDCCYCAPVSIPVSPGQMARQEEIHRQVNLEVRSLIPGLSGLAFTTRAEDAFRMIARGKLEGTVRVYEMGAGPYSFTPRMRSFST